MSLIEVIIAFALLAMVLTAITLGLGVGIRGSDKVDKQTTATQLACSQLEYILSQPYKETDSKISSPAGWEIEVAVSELTPNLLQEITVETFFEGKKILSLSVFKANLGYSL